jgi:hypothetical protein
MLEGMSYFAVTRKRGRSWEPAHSMREQDAWDAHAVFMDALASEGFVVLGARSATVRGSC